MSRLKWRLQHKVWALGSKSFGSDICGFFHQGTMQMNFEEWNMAFQQGFATWNKVREKAYAFTEFHVILGSVWFSHLAILSCALLLWCGSEQNWGNFQSPHKNVKNCLHGTFFPLGMVFTSSPGYIPCRSSNTRWLPFLSLHILVISGRKCSLCYSHTLCLNSQRNSALEGGKLRIKQTSLASRGALISLWPVCFLCFQLAWYSLCCSHH